MGSVVEPPQYDAIIVGSGFGGLYTLNELRKRNFKCLVIDEAADLGGVWYWNCYPGARVDSKVPLYELSLENLWKDWVWTEKYPGRDEIRRYFDHVESKLHLKKDIQLNSRVVAAAFNASNGQWTVETDDGTKRTAHHVILATGFAAKPYIPKLKNLDKFQGDCFHTARWPQEGFDYAGKRVGVIGNGSTGVQIIQEVSKTAKHMTVFQRTPSYALPLRQQPLSPGDQDKSRYAAFFEMRRHTFAGNDEEFSPLSIKDVSPEQREAHFEQLWADGGLSFWLANYRDVYTDRENNKIAYDFWRNKVLQRIKDPKVGELLAPEKAVYHFGTKRATLETRYFEAFNQDNVSLVDVAAHPIVEVTPTGVVTQDGVLHELDVLILATGFDSVTGGILNIDIHGSGGQSLREKWQKGTWTYLGLMTAGFPNLFFLYGPQGPTSFCTGPVCAEVQGNWIVHTLTYLRDHAVQELDPTVESEQDWRALVNRLGETTLIPETESEYMGTNIPGKPKEMLNYFGGLSDYLKRINGSVMQGFPGFNLK